MGLMRAVVCGWLMVAAAAVSAQDKLPAGVIARMGEVEFKAEDLRILLEAAGPEARAQLLQAPAELNRLIRTELLRRALATEARGKAWDKRPEVVAQLDRARDQALAASYMNHLARPPEGFPSDAEIRAVYDQNPATFTVPKQVRLSQIFVLAPPDSDKPAVARAQAKIADLADKVKKKPSDLPTLAKASSEHGESAAKGGDMGWASEPTLLPELRDAVAAMKKGDVSGPLRTSTGWHVIRLEDIRDRGVRPLAEVRDQISNAMRLRRAQETEQAYLTFMTNRTPVVVNEAELTRLGGAR